MKYQVCVSPFNFVDEVKKQVHLANEVIIHDNTLREGEQTPGVIFKPEDKLKIAKMLAEVGIQQIEAGFPAASEGEKKAVKAIAKEVNAQVFGFSRAVKSDIDAVIDCDAYGIVISFPPSDIHIKWKLKMTREEYLKRAVECVEYASEHGLYVSYSAEDSTRADLNFLKTVFKSVIDAAGGKNVRPRVVDTLGCITPTAMRWLVTQVKNAFPEYPIEVHCHNDHGVALANILAALEAGASVASTSVLGLGERCGLAPTEELIVCLHNFYGVETFETEKLYELCKLVSEIAGVKIPASKPICGENAFTHKAGIHQAGVLENPITYECYPPEMVGQKRRFVIDKLSGRHMIEMKLKELGIEASKEEVLKLLREVKRVSEERRSALTDQEFRELVKKVLGK